MKQAVIYFILFVAFWSCKTHNGHDLAIPDQVAVDTARSTTKFPGTNTFICKPADYTLVKQLLKLQKNEGTYIQIIQIPVATNFDTKRKELENFFQNAIASGKLEKEYYKKEFKLGAYSALLYYGKDDQKPGFEQIVLLFGDDSFVNMAFGEFPADDPEARKEVLAGLLSLNVNKSVTVDPSEIANFTLNTDNTEFKFYGSASQMFYYSIGGKGNPMQNAYENEIMLMTLPSMPPEQMKSYSTGMIDKYRNAGMTIPRDYSGKDTTINNNYAYQITYEGSFKEKKNYVYQIITGNEHGCVLFLGALYDRPQQLMPQVRSIAGTLQLK